MISFHNQSIAFKFKGKTKLKQWIKTVTEKEKHKLGTINYISVSYTHLDVYKRQQTRCLEKRD